MTPDPQPAIDWLQLLGSMNVMQILGSGISLIAIWYLWKELVKCLKSKNE